MRMSYTVYINSLKAVIQDDIGDYYEVYNILKGIVGVYRLYSSCLQMVVGPKHGM